MAHIHSVYDTDKHFSINPITRVIKNEASTKTCVIQYDHNSERFTFEIPRMVEDHDMSTCNVVQVHYLNVNPQTKEQKTGVYEVDDLDISPESDDVVILSWLISQNATQLVGSLNFLIRFTCVNEGTVDYVWNTGIYSGISVSSGIYNGEVIVEEYADILEQWRQDLFEFGGVTDEQIAAAVEDYIAENPVNKPTNEQIEQAVENYMAEHPVSGGNVDETLIADAVEEYMAENPVIPGATVEPSDDDIPKVFFGGALQQTKDEAVVPFRYISKTDDFSGYAEIKAQGNSSMGYPKKNQTVKLFKDSGCTEKLKVDFKGWGKQNKHVYKANWIDISHARNVVSARLWGDVVKSRSNYADLPELLRTSPNQGAVDGFPIKVYADGVYQGRYTMNIPKDKWMANMDDGLDTHCILCSEGYGSGCFRAAAMINGGDWSDEIHDTVPETIKTRWNEVISFVMNSTNEEFKTNLGNYFYIDSLIDYHLFGLLSCGLDAYGKNQIYMTYDGQKWIASMYDMDSTWGLWWTGGYFVATDYSRNEFQDFKDGDGNLLYIRLEQLFSEEIKSRWAELKNGALSIVNIINRFERFTDIALAELVAEDYASTTGSGAFTGIPSKTTNNIQQIRDYALARMGHVDEYISALFEPVYAESITLSQTSVSIEAGNTIELVATVEPDNTTETVLWHSSDNDVAVVNDGVVAGVREGSCTITAKIGSLSASCAVSVSGEIVTEINYVKSIASSGTQYIDTGIVITKDMNVTIELSDPSAESWEGYFGIKSGIGLQRNGTTDGLAVFVGGSNSYRAGLASGEVHTLSIDGVTGKVSLDGVEEVEAATIGTNDNSEHSCYVFAMRQPGGNIDTYGVFSLHGFTLKNNAGELLMELKPCLDASGNACVYDTVSQKYFYNAGTGSFTYEPLT